MLGHRLRQYAPALHVLGERRQNFAKARVLDRIAQVADAFEQRYAGAGDLLHVEAEGDQVASRDAAAGTEAARRFFDLLESDEVEAHASQPQFEVHFIGGVERAARGLSALVDGLVLKCSHDDRSGEAAGQIDRS